MDVEFKHEAQIATVSSPKFVKKFVVSKAAGGFIFFKVEYENGSPVPSELSGSYSSLVAGVKAVQDYIEASKETQAAKNERLSEERQQRKVKNAEPNSKGS